MMRGPPEHVLSDLSICVPQDSLLFLGLYNSVCEAPSFWVLQKPVDLELSL